MEEVDSEGVFKCKICGKTFTTRGGLNIHIQSKYDSCGLRYMHPSLHTENSSESEEVFKCKICGKAFTTRGGLNIHISIHTKEKEYSSWQKMETYPPASEFHFVDCGEMTNQDIKEEPHLTVHTAENPYPCDICNMGFTQKSSLKTHMVVHTREKPYSCTICGKSFRYRSSVSQHKKKCTGPSSALENETAAINSEIKQEVQETEDLPLVKKEKAKKNYGPHPKKYCSVFRCKTNDWSGLLLHNVKPEWLEHLHWKNTRPKYACQLHFYEIDYTTATGRLRKGAYPKPMRSDGGYKINSTGQSTSLENETAETSEIQFVDCGETIKQEIKEEESETDEMNPLEVALTSESQRDTTQQQMNFEVDNEFVDGVQKKKEDLSYEEIRNVVPHVVTSLDEPVTCAEFFV